MTDKDFQDVLAYLGGDASEGETRALRARMRTDPEFISRVIDVAGDEASLIAMAATEDLKGRVAAELVAAQAVQRRVTDRRFRVRFALAASLLGVVCLVAANRLIGRPDGGVAPAASGRESEAIAAGAGGEVTNAIAMVINESEDSRWYTERLQRSDIKSVHPGDTLRLNQGSVQIEFDHGTRVKLKAPAVIEVSDSMNARLYRGAIRVDVAKGAEGFTVATPSALVVDLGTEFGVRVDDEGVTKVAVFQGAIDIEGRKAIGKPDPSRRRLTAGEAIRMDASGTASRVVVVRSSDFPPDDGVRHDEDGAQSQAIISRVSDNITRPGGLNFYEIVCRGMAEDARAFVDRPNHQWNGIEPSGLPDELRGADYVRTFNSDKITEELEIAVELSRPATLYILLDKRVTPPEWLGRSFSKSDLQVGVDEGPWPASDYTEWESGVGPGESIDLRFDVWLRLVEEPGVVTLGSLGADSWNVSMYGIAATALE